MEIEAEFFMHPCFLIPTPCDMHYVAKLLQGMHAEAQTPKFQAIPSCVKNELDFWHGTVTFLPKSKIYMIIDEDGERKLLVCE